MNQEILNKIESENYRKEPLEFNVGDSVKVHTKVVEGEKERIQVFAGLVIGRRGHGINETFTVRRISYGEGVERVFPLFSPSIDSIDVVRRGDVRRAKLYYLRGRTGKSARIAEQTDGFKAKLNAQDRQAAEDAKRESGKSRKKKVRSEAQIADAVQPEVEVEATE